MRPRASPHVGTCSPELRDPPRAPGAGIQPNRCSSPSRNPTASARDPPPPDPPAKATEGGRAQREGGERRK